MPAASADAAATRSHGNERTTIMETNKADSTNIDGLEVTKAAAAGVEIQAADYADDIAALGIDPAQAEEFLQIIWDIMGRFVRLGIDVEICERIWVGGNIDFADGANTIDSIPPPPKTEKPNGGKRDA